MLAIAAFTHAIYEWTGCFLWLVISGLSLVLVRFGWSISRQIGYDLVGIYASFRTAQIDASHKAAIATLKETEALQFLDSQKTLLLQGENDD